MGMWDYFVSHIQLKATGDATIKDLLGEHEIVVCSACGFASAGKGGVKRHLQQCKKKGGEEVRVAMVPEMKPGIEDCGREDQEDDSGDPKAPLEIKDGMDVEHLNELGKAWLREYTMKIRTGVKLRHPTHAETQSIKKSQELACYVHQTINPL
jgi:hypothetical protein